MLLIKTIEIARSIRRKLDYAAMIIQLSASFIMLISSLLLVIAFFFAEPSEIKIDFVGYAACCAMGILQWRWRAAIWPAIKKHKLSLENTDLSA